MNFEKEKELNEVFERYICSKCKNKKCSKKIVIKDIESEKVKIVHSIKCKNYKFK